MKNFFIIILYLLAYECATSQTTTYYNKLLNSIGGAATIRNIVKVDSTYFLHIDNRPPASSKSNTYIYKLSQSGDILDSVIIGDYIYNSFAYPGNTFIVDNKGDLVIGMGYGGRAVLVKLTTNLDTLLKKEFMHPDSCESSGVSVFFVFAALLQTQDSGYVIMGSYNPNCDKNGERSFLLKTDSIGNIQWVKKYPNVKWVHQFVITPDQGFMFANFYNGYYLTKTDSLGNIQWQQDIGLGVTHYACGRVALTNDGCAIIAAPYIHYYNAVNNIRHYGINIIKVDLLTQNIVWNKYYKTYHSFRNGEIHQHFSLDILNDQSILISGNSFVAHSPPDSGGLNGVLLKFNNFGDSLWFRYYHNGSQFDESQLNDIIFTDDGGFVIAGQFFNFTVGYKAWLVKLDSLGCDTPGCHTVGIQKLQLSNTELQIFPNPTSNYLTIKTKDNTPLPQGTLQIFNMQGALQMEQAIPKHQNQVQINLSHLPAGLYLGRIMSSNGEGGGFRFVKE